MSSEILKALAIVTPSIKVTDNPGAVVTAIAFSLGKYSTHSSSILGNASICNLAANSGTTPPYTLCCSS